MTRPQGRTGPGSRLAGAARRIDGPRAAPVAVLAAGAVSAVVGAVAGVQGAPLGALLAAVLVVGFFWIGAVPLLMVGGDTSKAGLGLLVLLMTYALRLVALVLLLGVAAATDAVDVRWLATTVIVCTLVWVAAQVALVGRSRATL